MKKKKSLPKRIIKYAVITLLVLLVIIISLPFIFEGKIVQFVKDEANANLNAEVDFGEYSLTIFSSFPDFTLTLNDISVKGIKEFEGIQLAGIKSTEVTLDLWSVMSDQIEIHTIGLLEPAIHVVVLEDGTANYDIVKPSEEVETEGSDEESAPFQLALNNYSIENGSVTYDDRAGNMYLELKELNHAGSGDFTTDLFVFSTQTDASSATFKYDGVAYLNQVVTSIKADLDMDMTNMKFTFKENEAHINDVILGFDGFVAMPLNDIEMDLTYKATQTDFKNLLSLIPAIYSKDFDELETSGKMGFDGMVAGVYNETSMPGFNLNLTVDDAMFHYPGLQQSVTNIKVRNSISFPGGADLDQLVIDMSELHAEVGGNYIDASLLLNTPMTDPDINSHIDCVVDLSSIGSFYPVDEGENYSGMITSDITLDGRVSALEQERYEDFSATGTLAVADMNYKSETDGYDIAIDSAQCVFSPRFLELTAFESKMGSNDLSATGRIDNYMQYALKDEMLHGEFNASSNRFDLNELMADEVTADVGPSETIPEAEVDATAGEETGTIPVPANIDFTIGTTVGELIYDKATIKDVTGTMVVRNSVVTLERMSMNLLGGNMVLNGSYATPEGAPPHVEFGYDIRQLDINETATVFSELMDRIAPIAKKCQGKFNSLFNMSTDLTDGMGIDFASLTGDGTMESTKIFLEDVEPLNKLAEKLKIDRLAKQNVEDIAMQFEILDGKIYVNPYTVKMGSSTATIAGNTSFEQEIDYMMSIEIPRSEFGSGANNVLNDMLANANSQGLNISVGDVVPVKVKFGGTMTNPTVGTDLAEAGSNAMEQMMEQMQEQIQEAVEEQIEEIKEDVSAKAAEIMAQAEEEAARIRAEAKKAADLVVKEAEEKAQKLEDDAKGNMLKEQGAKIAADKLRKEAKEKSDSIIAEGDKKADAVLAEAQSQVDKLNNE